MLEAGRPKDDGSNADAYYKVLHETFEAFPSDHTAMRAQEMAYFTYFVTDKGKAYSGDVSSSLDAMIADGLVDFIPIVYEDFLPVSAAGIFASNASDKDHVDDFESSSKEDFEKALGHEVINPFALYAAVESKSIDAVMAHFKVQAA